MKLLRIASLLIACGTVGTSASANLLANPGFETGDFTGWTQSGDTAFQEVTTNTFYIHSGTYGAALGAVGDLGYISQTITTVPGQQYDISFWLKSDGLTPNEFLVQFGGVTLFDQTNIAAQAFTQYDFVGMATSTSTVVTFGERDDPGFFGFDDGSLDLVAPVPEPLSFTLFGAGLFGLSLTSRRKHRIAKAAN